VSRDGTIRFELGAFDRSVPLIIDPVVSYSSLVGGHGDSAATAIAADASGNVYVTGWTDSTDFPLAGPLQGTRAGGVDAFVFKLNASGNKLLYATYIGGSGDDRAYGIAVDGAGNAYVVGSTTSTDFPTHQAVQNKLAGSTNAFILKLNPAGNNLVFSTYLGGSGSESGNAIALDALSDVYVTGNTTSTGFPRLTPLQASKSGKQDAFVAKINSSGTLAYSTYLGGSDDDSASAIAVDSVGNAYVTGGTFSSDFPVVNAFQKSGGGGEDAFVAKLSPSGSSLMYCTYLGGSGGWLGAPEYGTGIAVDAQGNAFVAGATPSANFPTASAFQASPGGGTTNAFITKLNPLGSALVYSTYFGGWTMDYATAIAVDALGNAYVTGYTASSNLPLVSPVQAAMAGGYNAFVLELNSAGNALDFSTFNGGSGLDAANGIALDHAGNVYIVGQTSSVDFPVAGGIQPYLLGTRDAFVVKIVLGAEPDFSLGISLGAQTITTGGSTTYTVTVTPSNGFSGTVSFAVSGLPSGATATFNPPSVSGSGPTTLTVTTTANGGTGNFTVAVTGTSGSLNHTTSGGLTVNGAASSGPPSTVSVTPNAGSGSSQTFAFAFSDPSGAANIVSTQIVVSSSLATVGSCYFYYARGTNALYLADDSGAFHTFVALGNAGTAQNSQCSVNSGASSVSASGNTLTQTWP